MNHPPSPSRSTPQQARSTATQARLAKAAMELLQTKGYAGFRVQEVSQKAKVSRGAQTHHFATKDGLVLAAVEEMFRLSEEHSARRIAALKPDEDIVLALIEDGVDFFLGPHFLGTIDLITASSRENGAAKGRFRASIIESAQVHRFRTESAWLEALAARGIDRARADEAMWICFSVIRGMAVRRFIDDDAKERRRRLASLRVLLTDMLTSKPRKLAP